MKSDTPSATAVGTSLMRAAHTRLGDPPLIDDPWGDRLILGEERDRLRASSEASQLDTDLRAHPSYGTVILRTRFTEDALAKAVAGGASQYVILGAGMDSFALRRPAFAHGLRIFEIDHPATQGFKLQRLADRGVPLPADLHLIAVDLGEVSLADALARSAFGPDERAFFSWLGVTPYLTREANLATLAAIASCSAPGSELVFSYLDERLLDTAESDALRRTREQVAAAGEPWVSGFRPQQLADDLAGTGLELLENLGPDDLAERFCAGRADGLAPSRGSHLARARVPN
jgi:methyltransferase (TIGR00027 family)